MSQVSYMESEGYARLSKHYEDLMSYSWKFHNNFPSIESAKKRKRALEGDGLEVFIGTVTFDHSGKEIDRSRAIFTRKK
ncbi:Uncharacterised protein [uncultured archaeon]|nr:Uncharacterised protein [uncultured archaeon]